MAFASVYVPNFLVQAVVRAEPELRGRALALVEGEPPLWKIVAANEAALQAGIEIGMGGSQASQFLGVEIRRRSPKLEKAAHAALLDVGCSVSPRVESAAADIVVLDIAGLTSLFESVKNLAAVLAERTASVSLSPHVAVASNIEASIHAARGFPGITLIPPGEESERLSSLPVGVLFPSAEILETLDRWGIRTFGELAALPLLPLSERLGQEGVRLHELARGAYCRTLTLAQPQTFFEEEMALDYAVTELEPLSFLLGRLLDQLCARLEARSLAAGAFCLRLELQDSDKEDAGNFEIRRKSSASKSDPKTFEKMLRLPVPMRDSKTLLKLLRLQLQADSPRGSIVKISLSAEPARPRAAQKGLFIPDAPDPEKLEVTIARLAGLVGNANVGSPELVNTHRPGEFRMVPYASVAQEAGSGLRFSPQFSVSSVLRFSNLNAAQRNCNPSKTSAAKADFEQAVTAGLKPGPPKSEKSLRAAIAFRTFRPELAANVESAEGAPCRISFRGARGEVVAASGPWRTSGDWWEERGWRQDEWDMEIRFDRRADPRADKIPAPEDAGYSSRSGERLSAPSDERRASRRGMLDGIYRIYYDWTRRGWFVRGRYD
jgi:protein ImuB